MCTAFRTFPVWVEQLRAKVSKGMVDGRGTVASWARAVRKGERFHQKVRAFGRGEIPYLDLHDMLQLFAVIYDLEPTKLPRLQDGREKNGNPDIGSMRRRRGLPPAAEHPALRDLD